MHIVLVGDSVFDNKTYVAADEPGVIQQVRGELGAGEEATLLAVDGHVTTDVEGQLQRLPQDATHLFVSVGGNDALGHLNLFAEAVPAAGPAFARLHGVRVEFEARYREMLEGVLAHGLPVAACTVYYPRFDSHSLERLGEAAPEALSSQLQPMAMGALAAFNDAITRTVFDLGLPLIDLRLLCGEDQDFANPIEPSAHGGAKIARTIVSLARRPDGAGSRVLSAVPGE